MADPFVPVFDGHNDTLLRLVLRKGTKRERSFWEEASFDHIDYPRAKAGGLIGGFFAMFTPSRLNPGEEDQRFDPRDKGNFGAIGQDRALDFTLKMGGLAHRLARTHPDRVRVALTAADVYAAVRGGPMALLLHIEGAEAIDTDFDALDVLHAAGLRSLGLVWSRPNAFGEGAPMAHPSSPDTGNDLSDAGKALVTACNRLGILVDTSHLTEKGFWDVAATTDKPIVATHSNCHALCANARNLTDKQLDAIGESNGVVGINFHVAFVRPDGKHISDTPLDLLVRHADRLIARLGEDGVALGSDFDGCQLPREIGNVAGLQKLVDAFRSAGYGDELIDKICHRNWISVLQRTIG